GEYRIQAPRTEVWAALNDPEILKQAIPGCEAMEKHSDTEFTAQVRTKIGPVSAKFASKITLTDLQPPQHYKLVGEGQGGVAGFAQGSADVDLTEEGAETILRYSAEFKIGGKLAQLGSRLVAGVTRKTADQFFANFAGILNPPAPGASA
ncbi:MAG: carbon monoxide dehydrogenase subunit G, partial [Gammaproteobacteria bacterium]